jgi:hypothetical protein
MCLKKTRLSKIDQTEFYRVFRKNNEGYYTLCCPHIIPIKGNQLVTADSKRSFDIATTDGFGIYRTKEEAEKLKDFMRTFQPNNTFIVAKVKAFKITEGINYGCFLESDDNKVGYVCEKLKIIKGE